MDVGGVVELYPAKRIILRFDAGDTIVKQRSNLVGVISSFGNAFATAPIVLYAPSGVTHSLQISAGVGFRF